MPPLEPLCAEPLCAQVVIQKDSILLYQHKTKPGVIFTANCDVNLWNQACQRFDVGRSVYKHFFSQAVIPDGAWDKVLELLAEVCTLGRTLMRPDAPWMIRARPSECSSSCLAGVV